MFKNRGKNIALAYIEYKSLNWTDKVIHNFNFISLGYNDDRNYTIYQEEILFSLDELSPEKSIIANTFIPELGPGKGISYTDENGMRRYFSIAWSGIDGSLSLEEFENIFAD